jgi:hypothetical protein
MAEQLDYLRDGARIYERSSPWFEVDESHIPEGPRFGTFVLIIDPEKR